MIFGILALTLKKRTLGIVAIISGTVFGILWLVTGLVGGGDSMVGAIALIIITCLPDIIMGSISIGKKQASLPDSQNIGSSSLTDKLSEISSLKEKGVLTEEEYLEAKKNLLNK